MVTSKSKRPKKLSKWVYFGQQAKLSGQNNLLGANQSYIQLVRRANKPVIYLHELKNPKYKWEVGFDLVEGFGVEGVKLTEEYAQYVYEVLVEPESVKKDYGSVGAIQSERGCEVFESREGDLRSKQISRATRISIYLSREINRKKTRRGH